MHIALWSPAWPLEKHHNGIVTYVHWMKRELARQGHRVAVFTSGTRDEGDGPDVHRVERGFLGSAVRRVAGRLFSPEEDVFGWGRLAAEAMLRLHRSDPIDIIEMEESFGWSATVASVTSIPVLVKLHGPAFLSLVDEELATAFGKERVAREGLALGQSEAIASPCAITLTQTIERYGLRPAIASHVVNPMAADANAPLWDAATCDRDTLLFVGRFDARKGGDLVIEAFARLLETRPTLRLVFVGPDRGLLRPDGTRTSIQAFLAATLPGALRDRVDVRGALPQQEVYALRANAALTILASRWENQGYTALEAMLQGCPVVSSDAGGCPEIIEHGRTGLLARTGDAIDLAAQLARMLDDPAAAAAMGAQARRHVVENHAAEKVALQSLALYAQVIAHHAATPR